MKKLIALIAAAACMAIGLVGFSGTAAQAKDCPYTGCFDTDTSITSDGVVERRSAVRAFVRVTTNGNRTPRGKVRIRAKRIRGGFYRTIVTQFRGEDPAGFYNGPVLNRPGKYRITAIYVPGMNQPFNSSRRSMIIRVPRRR